MLTPYLPYPLLSGGQVRTYNLLKKISKQHEVTLFALIKDEAERQYIPELEKYCANIQVFRRTAYPWHPRNILLAAVTPYPFVVTRNLVSSVKGAIQKELNRQAYDLIHVETFYMMPNIPETIVPTILVEQTIEYLGYERFAKQVSKKTPFLRPLLNLDIKKIKYWEQHYWRSCQRLVAVSEDDRQLMTQLVPDVKNMEVVSNGVDMSFFSQVKKQLDPVPTVLFVGTFNWLPNVEAVEYLVEKVWPMLKEMVPGVQLRIVGTAPTKKILAYGEVDNDITVTGRVEDIRQEYARAHVLLAPVFSGKGTRYKVLEAMATRTPVVGTTLALEGIGAEKGKHYLAADDARSMAAQAAELLKNKAAGEKLASAAHDFVRDHYSWDSIAEELLKIYADTAH